jgi:hypothetical protein
VNDLPGFNNEYAAPPIDDGIRFAADQVRELIERLEPTLDAEQRRLLGQLRLAAESLGAIRMTASLLQRGQTGVYAVPSVGAWRTDDRMHRSDAA